MTPPQIRLISFCGTLTAEELNRPLPGFGFPTVLRQLAHTIGAEVYWQTVVRRGYSEEARMPALPDVAAIEAFREQTASVTRSYLEGASEAELNTPRVVTHIFNHQGQVPAMCRGMRKPNDAIDLDYPVD